MKQFEYPLDLHCSQTYLVFAFNTVCLNTLWIYTALKRGCQVHYSRNGLNTLWIYTDLKLLPEVFLPQTV